REPGEAGAGAGLHGPERDLEKAGDLALRQLAPGGELEHLALAVRQLLERPVHAPGAPARLRALLRARLGRDRLRHLRPRPCAGTTAVGERVARDGVGAGRAGAALGIVRAGGPRDGRERPLDGVLRAAAVAEPAQR